MSGTDARARLRAIPIWQRFLAVGAFLCALYLFVPPFAGASPVMNLLGLAPVIAIVLGLHHHRPESRGPWLWFALGFVLFWLGDIYTYSYPRIMGRDVPFPSIGDASYVLVYPALMAGLFMLVRRRNPGGDRTGAIDSLIITIGLALISWVVLIQPSVHADELSLSARLVSIAYPVGDILLLAAAIRLAVDTGARRPAFYLLAASIVALLATDFAYGVMTMHGAYDGQAWLDVGWISFYLLWGAAALHPSMRELDRPAERDTRLRPMRLLLLTCASLMAPVIALVQNLENAQDRGVVNVAAIVLFGLVVARMAGLVRQHERSVQRERILSAAGAELVAATSRGEIVRAALDASRSLAGPSSDARLCLLEDGHVAVASPEGTSWSVPALPSNSIVDRAALRLPAGELTLVELTVRGERHGVLVTVAERVTGSVKGSLAALATAVSLALESAALTEEVHRRAGEARFASLVQHASDLITVLDADGTVIYQSPSVERVLGYSAEDIVGTPFDTLLDRSHEARLPHLLTDRATPTQPVAQVFDCVLRHRDGGTRRFEMLCTNLLDDENVQGIVLNGRDVSERKAFEEQLAHQAFHDPVTNLANRALFEERVRHAVARARRERSGLAVVFMDLDDFKTVNDSLGHAAGDAVLLEVAKRLDASIRTSDTAARFGGDEFAVLLEDVNTAQDAADAAERILASLASPLGLEGKQIFVGSSLGLAVVDGDSTADADELIRNADAAMYIAKREGKGGYRLFEPEMHAEVLERLELRADLQRAMAAGELEVHYQPIVRLTSGEVSGMEALLRWRHAERGIVGPDVFIPLAEEMGLIVPIGRWVLREACRQIMQMQAELPGMEALTVAVNLSVKQLQHSDIAADVADALSESGLPAACLTLEITETVMMTDTDTALRRLNELKELGVRLAMDDFGTGYSSLSYLSQLPVDILKMDRSFLRAGASPQASALASVVVGLGESLHLDVVAEGIEYGDQWTALRDLGCDLGQGFLFARPMDAHSTLEYLRTVIPSPAADAS